MYLAMVFYLIFILISDSPYSIFTLSPSFNPYLSESHFPSKIMAGIRLSRYVTVLSFFNCFIVFRNERFHNDNYIPLSDNLKYIHARNLRSLKIPPAYPLNHLLSSPYHDNHARKILLFF